MIKQITNRLQENYIVRMDKNVITHNDFYSLAPFLDNKNIKILCFFY